VSGITFGSVTKTARMLARKSRSQVRVPPPPPISVRQVTVQSVASGPLNTAKTASVLLAKSANPFDVSYGPHYVPAAGDTCWVMFVGTTAFAFMQCQQ
jgi:hypothetical protein